MCSCSPHFLFISSLHSFILVSGLPIATLSLSFLCVMDYWSVNLCVCVSVPLKSLCVFLSALSTLGHNPPFPPGLPLSLPEPPHPSPALIRAAQEELVLAALRIEALQVAKNISQCPSLSALEPQVLR